VRKLVGRSESVARLECSSGTRIRTGGYRPQADRCETSPKTAIAAGGLVENDSRLIRRQNHG